jgi:hypothetical protein
MSIYKNIINNTVKNYTPRKFESLDMSEVLDIENDFSVCCESMIERLLDTRLDSHRVKIQRKCEERIEHFFQTVEKQFSDKEELMKRLTLLYSVQSKGEGTLVGWKRFMMNHIHSTLKDVNEMYFKSINNHKELISYGNNI